MLVFLPRGVRNNNPGNIRLSKTHWQGQRARQEDQDFIEFESPLLGIRAMMKILLTYHDKYHLDTVQSLINRWAPPHENATDRYVYHVSKALGVKRTDKIILTQKTMLINLTRAMVCHENGGVPKDRPQGWYAVELYTQAANLVLEKNNT
jgi:hypothetical protein